MRRPGPGAAETSGAAGAAERRLTARFFPKTKTPALTFSPHITPASTGAQPLFYVFE